IELATRILIDGGMVRRRAVRLVAGAVAVCGIPSAVNVSILENQDWVWGIALMISGLFISIAATQYGQERFRTELVNVPGNDFNLGRLYSWVLKYLVPAEFVAMFAWWMYQAATVYDPDGWWNPTHTFSVGTCLVQWGLAFVLLISFNKRMARASVAGSAEAA
ncbi:MAG: hypothetical protein QGG24_05940, partial [Vicinamibacterales bacterium]|nr:hypothetical protein [Vicinamibacterales bacterium]